MTLGMTATHLRLAALFVPFGLLAACETAGDGSFLPDSIIEMIPPGISTEQIYSRRSLPQGVRCYLYQETEIEILLGCVDVGLLY